MMVKRLTTIILSCTTINPSNQSSRSKFYRYVTRRSGYIIFNINSNSHDAISTFSVGSHLHCSKKLLNIK